eukprot:11984457-Alexandrium_andersonii.AAC.1
MSWLPFSITRIHIAVEASRAKAICAHARYAQCASGFNEPHGSGGEIKGCQERPMWNGPSINRIQTNV